jgi:hypothetical protein
MERRSLGGWVRRSRLGAGLVNRRARGYIFQSSKLLSIPVWASSRSAPGVRVLAGKKFEINVSFFDAEWG